MLEIEDSLVSKYLNICTFQKGQNALQNLLYKSQLSHPRNNSFPYEFVPLLHCTICDTFSNSLFYDSTSCRLELQLVES